ncbi:nitroreductase family deazaflavin-dependent oxidoreductase [Nocardia arthritidis]|uniref:nitroreductase family deazaflavin-dependent oxidoreductase n=1 Tax=Nocardia arthritidis TaxID=228602 RepID=UPI00142DACE1|nr:nitroreductase family deazaflavin-dependent oxidoreductase [Nocardia arthritidis]
MQLKSDVAAGTDAAPHWRAAAVERADGLGDPRHTNVPTWLVAELGGILGGGGRIKVVELMGRSGLLFFCYLPLGIRLVLFSALPRVDCELATLRTAWNAGARYEWHHHVYAARFSGLSLATVRRVSVGPEATGWTARQRLLLRAVDELHSERRISDQTRTGLAQHLTTAQLVDLCMLVGHYEMLAMLLISHGIEPEPGMWRRGPLRWLRDVDSGDGITPRWLPRFNRMVTNRISGVFAGKVPLYTVIHHIGRRSGRSYTTPVRGIHRDDLLIVPLFYGAKADWVRNLLAARGGAATFRGRRHKLLDPKVVDAAGATELPSPASRYSRIVPVLVAEVTD